MESVTISEEPANVLVRQSAELLNLPVAVHEQLKLPSDQLIRSRNEFLDPQPQRRTEGEPLQPLTIIGSQGHLQRDCSQLLPNSLRAFTNFDGHDFPNQPHKRGLLRHLGAPAMTSCGERYVYSEPTLLLESVPLCRAVQLHGPK